jgi:hypothetical protein
LSCCACVVALSSQRRTVGRHFPPPCLIWSPLVSLAAILSSSSSSLYHYVKFLAPSSSPVASCPPPCRAVPLFDACSTHPATSACYLQSTMLLSSGICHHAFDCMCPTPFNCRPTSRVEAPAVKDPPLYLVCHSSWNHVSLHRTQHSRDIIGARRNTLLLASCCVRHCRRRSDPNLSASNPRPSPHSIASGVHELVGWPSQESPPLTSQKARLMRGGGLSLLSCPRPPWLADVGLKPGH